MNTTQTKDPNYPSESRTHQEFLSWSEFVAYVSQPGLPNHGNASGKENGYGGQGWNGTRTYKDALKLADSGWAEGIAGINKISASLTDIIASTIEVPDITYDVEGSGIDVARYLLGEPECWMRMEMIQTEAQGGRLIKLAYNCGMSGSIKPEALIKKGSIVVALVQLLEYAGYRVQVTIVKNASNRASFSVPVKDFDQSCDLAKLAFALANPAMLRRFAFRWLERMDTRFAEQITSDGSYGYSRDVTDHGADIYIGSNLTGSGMSEEQMTNWIKQQLQAVGVTLNAPVEAAKPVRDTFDW